jgi:toxin ParE1/3/4
MELVWLPRARYERRSQIAYIALHDPQAALDVGGRFRNSIEILADFPRAGRPGRMIGTHELVITKTSLVAIYRIDDGRGEVHILRILHARQKWPPE